MFRHLVRALILTIILNSFLNLTASTAFAQQIYEPTTESLSKHEVPEWFKDAKLGIFIHWGVYSVPAWAPLTGEQNKVVAERGWEYPLKASECATPQIKVICMLSCLILL